MQVLLARLEDGVEESKRQMILMATGGFNIRDSLIFLPIREEVVAIATWMKCRHVVQQLGNPTTVA